MKTKGFTLIELVAVIIILGLLAAASSGMMAEALRSYYSERNIVDANWQGRLALARMVRDISAIRSSSDITTLTAGTLSFTNTNGVVITYTTSGIAITRQEGAGSAQTLADGVNSLAFTYFDETGATTAVAANVNFITITVNITKNDTNYSFVSTIVPRNLS